MPDAAESQCARCDPLTPHYQVAPCAAAWGMDSSPVRCGMAWHGASQCRSAPGITQHRICTVSSVGKSQLVCAWRGDMHAGMGVR